LNILLINHYAGSPTHGMEYRPYYFAREWVRQGHKVLIVACSESHVRSRQPEMGDAAVRAEQIDGIDYLWLRGAPYRGNGVDRVWNMVTFLVGLYRQGRQIAEQFCPDLVIASSTYPMDIWPARRIARLAGARLMHEVHDLWPLSPMELGGMSRWHPFILWVQAAEDAACRHADLVVSMLPKVHDHLAARGLDLRKLHIVPNGIDPDEWQGEQGELPAEHAALFARLRSEGRSVVGYAGAHGVANALDALLDAAMLMREQPVAFVLVGGGPEKEALQRRAAAMGLHHLHFASSVAKTAIPALLAQFDIAYIGLQRQPLFRFGIAPNKLMDYMMAARPVLMAIEAGNDPVGESGCGRSVAPESPSAIVVAIAELLALSPAERAAIGQRGRDYVLANHAYPALAARFIDLCRAE